jgi:hypothetical protein
MILLTTALTTLDERKRLSLLKTPSPETRRNDLAMGTHTNADLCFLIRARHLSVKLSASHLRQLGGGGRST